MNKNQHNVNKIERNERNGMNERNGTNERNELNRLDNVNSEMGEMDKKNDYKIDQDKLYNSFNRAYLELMQRKEQDRLEEENDHDKICIIEQTLFIHDVAYQYQVKLCFVPIDLSKMNIFIEHILITTYKQDSNTEIGRAHV